MNDCNEDTSPKSKEPYLMRFYISFLKCSSITNGIRSGTLLLLTEVRNG